MPMNNEELMAKFESAFKNIVTPAVMGTSLLQPAKFDQFVRQMQARTTILQEARFIEMDAQQVDIDRIAFMGRVLRSGGQLNAQNQAAAQGQTDLTGNTGQWAQVTTATNSLVARELQAICSIRDRTLRRNIERNNLENTLIQLFGEAAGRDFEEWALLAQFALDPAAFDLMALTDGWVTRAGNAIYGQAGGGGAAHFDPAGAGYPDNMFNAMLQAIPKQYLQNLAEWRFYVDWDVYDGYRDNLRARGTALGDSAQTEDKELRFKGIPVRYAPMVERSPAYNAGTGTFGRVSMLQHPDNMAWGVLHEVTIEPDRIPKDRRTDFVLTFEGDANYEDENAAVTAFIDVPRP